jgi:WD40 repeat protein
MSRNSWSLDDVPAFRDGVRSTSGAHFPVRLSIAGLLKTGLLCALGVTAIIWAVEPPATDDEEPAWSLATWDLQGVRALAFSADSRWLASGACDGSVVLWRPGHGSERELLDDDRSMVNCLAFSADGMTIAAGYVDGAVVLWDVTTGEKRGKLTGQTGGVLCLVFSLDGRTLAIGSSVPGVRLWDVASGRIKVTLSGHHDAICSVRFTPDGRTLAAGGAHGAVVLWDVSTGRCLGSRPHNFHPNPVQALAISPDGLTLASGDFDVLKLWDIATGLEQAAYRTELDTVREIVFSAKGRALIAADSYGSVYFRVLSGPCARTVRLANLHGHCSKFSPDGSALALADPDGNVRIWNLDQVVNRRLETSVADRFFQTSPPSQ